MRAELVAVALLLPVAACTRDGGTPLRPPETRAERLAALARIAADCRVPRSMFILVGEDELLMRPNPDERYEHIVCALRRVEAANIRLRLTGFVGNEVIQPDNGHAPPR